MRIARVFAKKTNYCPDDPDAYFDVPTFSTPQYDEVHVSVTFTWDIERGRFLARAWAGHGRVLLGGPAFDQAGGDFVPGMYVRRGVVFTSRGCPCRCPDCFVPSREGSLRLLPIVPGNVIQDNNFLSTPPAHQDAVFAMLAGQRQISFSGGLEAARLTPAVADRLAGIRTRIESLFLACDSPAALPAVERAIGLLQARQFPRWKIRCYMIIGKDMAEEEARLRRIFLAGCLPFPQLLQPLKDRKVEYPSHWTQFQNVWCRPARTKAHMKEVTGR